MKRTDFYRILPLAAAMLTAGCMTDLNEEPLTQTGGNTAGDYVPFALTASVAGMDGGTTMPAATRAATGIQSTQFDAGETFYAYFPTGVRIGYVAGTYTTFELNQDEEDEGVSDGSTTPETQPYFAAGVSTVRVHAYYPQSVTNATTSFSVALDQTATANYKASDLMYATTSVTVDKSTATSATGNLTFTHKMAKIIVNATAGAGINTIRKVRIVGGSKTIAIANPATTDESVTAYLGTTVSDAITAADDGCVKLYDDETGAASVSCAALIPPQRIPAEGSTATDFLQVTTDQGTATYSLSGKSFDSGAAYTYNITVSLAAIGVTTSITDWTAQTTQYLYNIGTASANVEAVDLGLSVLWANMNVGATAVTDYGTFFAWGETDGITVSGATTAISGTPAKTYFSWDTYAWCNGAESSLTKYSTDASYWDDNINSDTPDGKTQLELGDDAARANWGGKWRMPTQAEMEALVATKGTSGYTWTWKTDYNSVSGCNGWEIKCTSTGGTIFLPAAGVRGNASFYYQGSFGRYWSSTLLTDYPYVAWYLDFGSSGAYTSDDRRYVGYTVRAVLGN